jgi:hypothetical protein
MDMSFHRTSNERFQVHGEVAYHSQITRNSQNRVNLHPDMCRAQSLRCTCCKQTLTDQNHGSERRRSRRTRLTRPFGTTAAERVATRPPTSEQSPSLSNLLETLAEASAGTWYKEAGLNHPRARLRPTREILLRKSHRNQWRRRTSTCRASLKLPAVVVAVISGRRVGVRVW